MPYGIILCHNCGDPFNGWHLAKWCKECWPLINAEQKLDSWKRTGRPGPKNKELTRRTSQIYNAANRERLRNRRRAWYDANRERENTRKAAWDRAHPVQARMRVEKRRALKLGAVGEFTEADWLDLLEWTEHRCFYCGKRVKLEQDHLIPLSRQGAHDRTNIVPACRSCNSRKKDKTYEEFVEWLVDVA